MLGAFQGSYVMSDDMHVFALALLWVGGFLCGFALRGIGGF
jgi:hypothetical protein